MPADCWKFLMTWMEFGLFLNRPVSHVDIHCHWFTFTHLKDAWWGCHLSVMLIIYGSACSQKHVPCGKAQGEQFLVALLWDNAARKASPKGCCCNQILSFPSSALVHRRNGSADRRSATLSAGKRSASASYQGWQLTVAQWLDFSDNLLFVPPAPHHSCNLAPYMTSQWDVSWGELKSLPTYCTYITYIFMRGCCTCGLCFPTHTTSVWWGCPVWPE